MEEEQFSKYLKENNIIVYAVADDSTYVVEMACYETEFSKSIRDFKNIKLIDVKDFADGMGILTYNIESVGDASYIISCLPTDDSSSEGKVTQYITVKQEKLYVITFTAAKSIADSGYEKKIISGISYNFSYEPEQIYVWHIVIVSAAIILVIITFVCILVTVIKDLKKRKNVQNDQEEPEKE